MLIYVLLSIPFAYFGGSYFQGPKIAPKLSPKKTWAGLISGMIGGAIIAALLSNGLKMGPVTAAIISAPVVIISVIGDFLESTIKRRMDVKDAGDILPGHGGFLDRFDAFIFVIPFLALYIVVFT